MEAQNAQMPEIPVAPPVNKTADIVVVLGALTGTCEVVPDAKGKNDCRKLLEPLEHGKLDPIDAFANMMLEHPEAVNDLTDRFNWLMMKAGEKAEEMVKSGKATMPVTK